MLIEFGETPLTVEAIVTLPLHFRAPAFVLTMTMFTAIAIHPIHLRATDFILTMTVLVVNLA
jgi:hypothetical protein